MKTSQEFNDMMYIAQELVQHGVLTRDEYLDLTINDHARVMTEYKKIVFGLTTYKTNKFGQYQISIN